MDFAGQKEQDVLQNKPKFNILVYLYSCIYLHTCFLPNEANPKAGSWPLAAILPNEPNLKTPHLCNLCNLWFLVLQNKPNFPNFDLKMRISAENKPNFKAQASVLEGKSASAPGVFLNFAFCLLVFDMILPNEPNLHPHILSADYFLYFTMSVNRG